MVKIGDRVYLRGNAEDIREVLELRNDEAGHVESIEKASYVLVRSTDGRGVCGWGLDAIVNVEPPDLTAAQIRVLQSAFKHSEHYPYYVVQGSCTRGSEVHYASAMKLLKMRLLEHPTNQYGHIQNRQFWITQSGREALSRATSDK